VVSDQWLSVVSDQWSVVSDPATTSVSSALVSLTTDHWPTLTTDHCYCLNPIQLSDTTSEFPGLCGSYFTDVGSPSRQECRLIHWRR
jgi:hypothetical protein